MINKNFDKNQIERSFRISLVDTDITSNHSSEYHTYSEKEKGNCHFNYYRGLASLYAKQKFERIRLYLKACIQSVNKDDLNEYDQIFNLVKEFICQEFEDIEQDLKTELSIELKDKYDYLQIPGKVEEKFNSREFKFKEILSHKMDGIMRYVKDQMTLKFVKIRKSELKPDSQNRDAVKMQFPKDAKWLNVKFKYISDVEIEIHYAGNFIGIFPHTSLDGFHKGKTKTNLWDGLLYIAQKGNIELVTLEGLSKDAPRKFIDRLNKALERALFKEEGQRPIKFETIDSSKYYAPHFGVIDAQLS